MTNGDVCISPLNGHYELFISPLNGHYELFGAHVWFVWFVWFVWLVWFVWSVCRAKFTPLNRVLCGKFNGADGPHQWVNPKLFEAVRPCFWDLASKPI